MKELGMTKEELSQKNGMTMDQVDDLLFGDLNLTIDDITVLEQILDIKLLSMGT